MPTAANVYFFHPTCEMAIANGTVSWRPNRFLQQFESDLSLLPAYFALPDDVVLVPELPSKTFLDSLKKQGFQPPNFFLFEKALTETTFIKLPKNEIRPWGWSPMMLHRLKPLYASCSESFQQSVSLQWNYEKKQIHSRLFSLNVLEQLVSVSNVKNCIGLELLPVVCNNEDDVIAAHNKFKKSMLKAPWSSSGRGVHPVRFSRFNASILNWVKGIINNQGYVMCEPLHDKVADFSFQFEIRNQTISYLGNTWFFTDEKGQYQGHTLNPIDQINENEIASLFRSEEKIITNALVSILQPKIIGIYEGFFGVDAMIIRNSSGDLTIHPCLEINFRYTMGFLSLRLAKVFEEKYARFEIVRNEKNAETTGKLLLTPITEKTNHFACLSV